MKTQSDTKRLKALGLHSANSQAKQLQYEASLKHARDLGFTAYCESDTENPFTDEREESWLEGYNEAKEANGNKN